MRYDERELCRPTEDAEASPCICRAAYASIPGQMRQIPQPVRNVRANRGVHAQERLAQHPGVGAFQRVIRVRSTRMCVVRKDTAQTAQHADFQADAVANRYTVWNLDTVTDANSRVNGHALAQTLAQTLAQMQLRPMTAPSRAGRCGQISAPSPTAALGETFAEG